MNEDKRKLFQSFKQKNIVLQYCVRGSVISYIIVFFDNSEIV